MEFWVQKTGEVDFRLWHRAKARRGFTLIELLVVITIIAMLLGILVPTFGVIKKKASVIHGIVNQRSMATSLNLFANDHDDRFPDSTATTGNTGNWNWTDPRLMISYQNSYNPRMSNGGYRSMSAYLSSYIDNPEILHCTNSPSKYKYIQESWQAADQWDNPDRIDPLDPMTGSYCFWWNYKGVLPDYKKVFMGPRRSSGGNGQSRILISDYFGSDTWRNQGEYGSCESFGGASIAGRNSLFTDFYTGGNISLDPPEIKLNAAYTDGHVESYTSSDVVTLEVCRRKNGKLIPFHSAIGKGKFYLPRSSMP